LSYIKTKYTSSPSYLKVDGKPVIFVYNAAHSGYDPLEDLNRWQQARQQTGFYVVLKVDPLSKGANPAAMDSWYQYAPAARYDKQSTYSSMVSPGFWLFHESPRLVRDPAAFESAVAQMAQDNVQWKLIETWNEWGEGTGVEPAQEITHNDAGTFTAAKESYADTYVDILGRYLGGTGSSAIASQRTQPLEQQLALAAPPTLADNNNETMSKNNNYNNTTQSHPYQQNQSSNLLPSLLENSSRTSAPVYKYYGPQGSNGTSMDRGAAIPYQLPPEYQQQLLQRHQLSYPYQVPFQELLPVSPSLASPSLYLDTSLPDTFIASAIYNSTSLNMQNGVDTTTTTTASNSIVLTFAGTDDSVIAGYSCSIDNLPTFTCSSPVVLDKNVFQLAAGISNTGNTVHTFQVSATDLAGNKDPTPAVFNWSPLDTDVPESNMPSHTITPENTIIPYTGEPPFGITSPFITPETILPNIFEPQGVAP
jgi:hypothetical protein